MRLICILIASIFAVTAQAKTYVPKPYIYPQVKQHKITAKTSLTRPGYCELEVANLSHKTAFVDFVYDNFSISAGHRVDPGYSLYAPLNYSGHCHRAVYTLIYSPEHIILYKGFGYTDQVLRILSGFNSNIAVKQIKK